MKFYYIILLSAAAVAAGVGLGHFSDITPVARKAAVQDYSPQYVEVGYAPGAETVRLSNADVLRIDRKFHQQSRILKEGSLYVDVATRGGSNYGSVLAVYKLTVTLQSGVVMETKSYRCEPRLLTNHIVHKVDDVVERYKQLVSDHDINQKTLKKVTGI